jgi:hypothetical protein
MFRSRRSSFLAASVLLLAACGGGGDSADRQRNEAIEELCTYSPTGTVDPNDGKAYLSFCEEAKSYTLVLSPGIAGSQPYAPAADGVSFDPGSQGDRVEIVVRSASSGNVAGTTIERVAVQVENDNSVTVTEVTGDTTTTPCLIFRDIDVIPMEGDIQWVPAVVTCEGATKVKFTDGEGEATKTLLGDENKNNLGEVNVTWTLPAGEQTIPYEVLDAEDAVLQAGTFTVTGGPGTAAPVQVDATVTGGSLAVPAEETTTTVEGSTEPPSEETTTIVEGAPEETTTTAAGSSELTLEEKWADCRNAPVVTFDKAAVESSGILAYTVKWACLKYMNGENFDQMVSHSFNDGSFNYTYSSGDALKQSVTGDTFSYSGPIGAGTHDFSIGVSYNGIDHGWWDGSYFDRYLSTFTVDPSVSTFATCRKDDIKVSRGKMTMDCDVTGLFELRLIKDWKLIKASGGSIDLSSLADGWNEGSLYVESGAVSFYVNGLYCATKCDEEQSSLKVERTIGEDNFWSFKVTRPSWCADPMIAWLHGYKYSTIARGVREEIDEEMFWDDLEFGMVVGPEVSMVRVGDSRYWCNDPFGNWQTEAVWADYIITGDPAETPETTTTLEAPATTAAPETTVPAGPVIDVPVAVLVPQPGGASAEIQVPSGSGGLGVSAASIEAILANARTDVPVVVATFDTGDKVALRRGRDAVLKVPTGAKSVTFTAFKKDGTKVETTATITTVKPLVKVAIKSSSSGGSGIPVFPVGAAVVVLLAGAAVVLMRRRATPADN